MNNESSDLKNLILSNKSSFNIPVSSNGKSKKLLKEFKKLSEIEMREILKDSNFQDGIKHSIIFGAIDYVEAFVKKGIFLNDNKIENKLVKNLLKKNVNDELNSLINMIYMGDITEEVIENLWEYYCDETKYKSEKIDHKKEVSFLISLIKRAKEKTEIKEILLNGLHQPSIERGNKILDEVNQKINVKWSDFILREKGNIVLEDKNGKVILKMIFDLDFMKLMNYHLRYGIRINVTPLQIIERLDGIKKVHYLDGNPEGQEMFVKWIFYEQNTDKQIEELLKKIDGLHESVKSVFNNVIILLEEHLMKSSLKSNSDVTEKKQKIVKF